MTVREVVEKLNLEVLAGEDGLDREVKTGYACDLLSWAMSHGRQGTAWITIQTHINVVAVATLVEMACVILPEATAPDASVIDKANEEQVAILSSELTAYELCARLHELGVASA